MHVLYSFGIGGLENGVVNLINRMDSSKFSHSICCIGSSGRFAGKVNSQNIAIFEMNKADGSELCLPLRLARLFRKSHIDIVHTRNWGTIDGIIGAKFAGIPVVVHGEHGRDMSDPDGTNKKRNLIRKGLSYLVDRYITVSEDLREWLITVVRINAKKVRTIRNGVDTVAFNPDNKDFMRTRHGLNDKEIVIGTVGRLDPVKDQQLLIKAFARLTSKYHNLRLLIIGNGPCRENLERLTNDLSLHQKVLFLGMRHDVPQVLKLLDIFVLPSITEGISNTILEAMATGIPVVASRVGGNPELIVDGETGFLFQKQDCNALAKTLKQYIENRLMARRHGAAGRERAVHAFCLERMVPQYEEFYTRSVMSKKPGLSVIE